MFVANHYRKEVTSTVLWLLDHDIQVQCFRATPYSMGEQLFLQIEQIIPAPETKELMVSISEKKKEVKISDTLVQTNARLLNFWANFKQSFAQSGHKQLDRVSAKPHYGIGFHKGGGEFGFVIGRHALRVELYIANDADKVYFDAMYKYKDEIEKTMGKPIQWERLDGKKASRIKSDSPEDTTKEWGKWGEGDLWQQQRFDWYSAEFDLFYKAVLPVWEKVQSELK